MNFSEKDQVKSKLRRLEKIGVVWASEGSKVAGYFDTVVGGGADRIIRSQT